MEISSPYNIREQIHNHIDESLRKSMDNPCKYDDGLVSYSIWTGPDRISRSISITWCNGYGDFPEACFRNIFERTGKWILLHVSTTGNSINYVLCEKTI